MGGVLMRDERIIVALDMHTMEDMTQMVNQLGDSVSFYKVGMELFYSVGIDAITYLKQANKQVFLDLKLHDIPHTVAQSVRALTRLGVDLVTVHGLGGRTMLSAAVEAAKQEAEIKGVKRPKILAVTILTSMDTKDWQEIGGAFDVSQEVSCLASVARLAGVDGMISSPHEAKVVRQQYGSDFLIVTPGIRPAFSMSQDQKRIATPAQALRNGASYLVIGRPITAATNPQEAAEKIIEEIREV